jgi:uncharacterized cupin superfamily protein
MSNWSITMSKSALIAAAATADLNATPIARDWILDGKPETRSKELARSHDRTSYVMVWDCREIWLHREVDI